MGKATNAEVDLRVEKVIELLLEGQTRYQIVQYGSKTWQISNRQVDDYIADAWEKIQEVTAPSRAQHVGKHLRRLENLARRCAESGDHSVEAKVYELQAKVLGIEIAPAEQAPRLEIPDDQLDAAIEQESVH